MPLRNVRWGNGLRVGRQPRADRWAPVPGQRRRGRLRVRAGHRPELAQRNVAIAVKAERDLTIRGLDRATQVELAGTDAEIGVAEDHAQQQQAVGTLDQLGQCRIAGDAQIGTGQGGIGTGQQAPPHERGDDRDRQLACQRGDAGLQAVTPDLDVDQQHRPVRRPQPRDDLVGAGGDGLRIATTAVDVAAPARRHAHHVARHLEIDRPRLLDGGTQHPRDLRRCGRDVVEPGLGAGDLLIDPNWVSSVRP